MNNITIADIVRATSGVLLCGDKNMPVSSINIDSRVKSDNSLFIPIIGEKNDGHEYIQQAFENGASSTLTSRDCKKNDTHCWIYVEDTIRALKAIGHMCRERIKIPVVAVTGSVGKTTTREMIAAALSSEKKVFKTYKNYNSKIGMPLTLSMMTGEDDIAVLEVGMNIPGELSEIACMAGENIAVITNIGVAHMEYYGTKESICKEKLSICDGLEKDGILIVNGDDELLRKHAGKKGFKTFYYGLDSQNDYRAENIRQENGALTFTFVKNANEFSGAFSSDVSLSVIGRHNVLNALAALAVCDCAGVDLSLGCGALYSCTGFSNRLQIIKNGDITYIDDTYNASPDSMKSGLNVLSDIKTQGRKIAVLGDMLELGTQSDKFHYEVGKYAAALPIDECVTVGYRSKNMAKAIKDSNSGKVVESFDSTDDAYKYLSLNVKNGDTVYLKASNGMGFKNLLGKLKNSAT